MTHDMQHHTSKLYITSKPYITSKLYMAQTIVGALFEQL